MQGKAALERLISEISSEYFPNNKQEAVQILAGGPLARARPALARNLLIVLLKELLTGDLPKPEHMRRAAAARAVIEMHPETAEITLSEKVNALIVSLEDKHLMRGVATIYRVPEVRPFLQDNAKLKLGSYVANVNEEMLVPMFAAVVEIDFLKSQGIGRVPALPRDFVAKLGTLTPPLSIAELDDRVVELYESSVSFDQANVMAAAISNLAKHFDPSTAERTLRAAMNQQVRYSNGFRGVVEAVKNSSALSPSEFNRLLAGLDLTEDHADLLYPTETQPSAAGPFGPTPAADTAVASVSTGPDAHSPL